MFILIGIVVWRDKLVNLENNCTRIITKYIERLIFLSFYGKLFLRIILIISLTQNSNFNYIQFRKLHELKMKNKKLLDGIFTAVLFGILIEKVMQWIKWKLLKEKISIFQNGKYEDKISPSITGWSKVSFTGCYHQMTTI